MKNSKRHLLLGEEELFDLIVRRNHRIMLLYDENRKLKNRVRLLQRRIRNLKK